MISLILSYAELKMFEEFELKKKICHILIPRDIVPKTYIYVKNNEKATLTKPPNVV